jgi:hypothetical protein
MGSAADDQSSTFGPEDLKILYRAFDTAWNVVKSHYAANPQSIEVGRLRLANAVLAAYRNGPADADALSARAVDGMRHWSPLAFTSRAGAAPTQAAPDQSARAGRPEA